MSIKIYCQECNITHEDGKGNWIYCPLCGTDLNHMNLKTIVYRDMEYTSAPPCNIYDFKIVDDEEYQYGTLINDSGLIYLKLEGNYKKEEYRTKYGKEDCLGLPMDLLFTIIKTEFGIDLKGRC